MTDETMAAERDRHVEAALTVCEFDEQSLFVSLEDDDEAFRTAAARRLHLHGTKTSFHRAVRLASDTRPALREMAAFVLGQLGTPRCPFAAETFPLLSRLLADDDLAVRSAAATATGSLATLGHQPPRALLNHLKILAADEHPELRESVAFALAFVRDRSAELVVEMMTHDRDRRVRAMAELGREVRETDGPPRSRARRRHAGAASPDGADSDAA